MKERIIKTVVPYIVGWIGAQLALIDVVINPEMQVDLTNMLTLLIGSLYYVVIVLLSKRWPKLEVLLGSSKKPDYK